MKKLQKKCSRENQTTHLSSEILLFIRKCGKIL